ncbi:MAG: biotin/lipoyl-binding protein, partial [Bacteroidia bacterium]|nr:biotin/lipoyl-binding protein [Bacteroidia bacterium]
MKKNKKKLWIIGIAAVILLVVLAMGKKKGWFGNGTEIKVSVETVSYRNLVETVAANGKIQPETEVKITPYISGEIVALYVREGDEVSAGDLLAIVDPELYITAQARAMASLNTTKANEASARARLAQAEAQFKNSELNFYRTQSLWEQKVISNSEFESAEANYQVAAAEVDAAKQSLIAAEYNVKSAEANVKEANENLTKTKIYAPISGTVSLLNIEKGERVAGASTFSAGTEILRIANLAAMEVNVEVNENDIIRVELNDTCLIEVDAHLG